LNEIDDDLVCACVPCDSARRHAQLEGAAIASALLVLRAVTAAIGAVQFLVPVQPETVHRAIRHEHDVPTAAAIAAIGTAARHELLSVETDEPVATVSRRHMYLGSIDQRTSLI
jgi:hypothetical protein